MVFLDWLMISINLSFIYFIMGFCFFLIFKIIVFKGDSQKDDFKTIISSKILFYVSAISIVLLTFIFDYNLSANDVRRINDSGYLDNEAIDYLIVNPKLSGGGITYSDVRKSIEVNNKTRKQIQYEDVLKYLNEIN